MTKRRWSPGEVTGLLAWLDFCLLHSLPFDNTIVAHMKQVTQEHVGDNAEFTLNAIHTKLCWFKGTAKISTTTSEIFEKGSKCIPIKSLRKEMRESIEETVRGYERAFVRTKEGVLASVQSYVGENISIRCDQAKEVKEEKKRGLCDKGEMSENRTAKPSPQKSDKMPGNGRQDAPSSTIKNSIVATNSGPASGTIRVSNLAGKPNYKQNESLHRPPILPPQPAKQGNSVSQTSTSIANLERLGAELKQKSHELETIRSEWARETHTLHTQIAQLKETKLTLEAENRHLILARQERERAGKGFLEQELFQKNAEIWKLTSRIGKMQSLACFAQHDPEVKMRVDKEVVGAAMERIREELESLVVGGERRRVLTLPKVAEGSDLGTLIRGVCFEGSVEIGLQIALKRLVLKFGLEVFLRSLCIAAVRDWVFHSDFPNFAPEDLGLLSAYREAVMIHDGWDRLHNLELAAHNRLIEDQRFQQVLIPKKAQTLITRFLRVLLPFFVTPKPDMPIADVGSWGRAREEDVDRRFRLTQIFEAALRLKAATITSDEQLEFVVYPPGTLYDGADAGDGEQREELWLMAQIHIYPAKGSSPTDAMADALVQQRNFVVKSEQERRESSEYHKALLLPKRDTILDQEFSLRQASVPQFELPACSTAFFDDRKVKVIIGKGKGKEQDRDDSLDDTVYVFDSERAASLDRIEQPEYNSANKNKRRSSGMNRFTSCMECQQKKIRCLRIFGELSCDNCTQTQTTCIAPAPHSSKSQSPAHNQKKRKATRSEPSSVSSSETPGSPAPKKSKSMLSGVNGERKFKCHVCPKGYKNLSSLTRHLSEHPLCLREGKGHVVDESALQLGQPEAPCQVCGTRVVCQEEIGEGGEVEGLVGSCDSGEHDPASDTRTEKDEIEVEEIRGIPTSSQGSSTEEDTNEFIEMVEHERPATTLEVAIRY